MASEDFTKEDIVAYAASGEQESSHILARSLVAYAKAKKLPLLPVTNLEEVTGQGIQATRNYENDYVDGRSPIDCQSNSRGSWNF